MKKYIVVLIVMATIATCYLAEKYKRQIVSMAERTHARLVICAVSTVLFAFGCAHTPSTYHLYQIKSMIQMDGWGENYLLGIMDRYKSHEDYMRRINRALQTIGNNSISNRGKKIYDPMFPHITTYWARHTWATIAASLDIPKETIAAGLGHGGNTVTDIYIDFDRKKVDEANRRVIDWVYYGIR